VRNGKEGIVIAWGSVARATKKTMVFVHLSISLSGCLSGQQDRLLFGKERETTNVMNVCSQ